MNIASNINISNILLSAFLFLSFTLPRVFQVEKIALIIILLIILLNRKRYIKNNSHIIIYALLFLIPFIVGILNNNEFGLIWDSVRVFLIFPILIFLVICNFSNIDFQNIFAKVSFISIIFISISGLISFLYALNIVPFNLNSFFYENEGYVGVHDGYYHIVNSPLSYLIFLIPFYFFKGVEFNLKSVDFLVFIFSMVICVLSSRRILLLPYLLVLIFNLKKMKYSIALITVSFILLIVSGKIDVLYFDVYMDRLINAINSTDDSEVRDEQKDYFIKYIFDRPFEGYGLGAYMSDYLRNNDFKSAYESSLHYLVFALGIPMSFVFLLYYWFLYRKAKLVKSYNKYFVNGILLGSLSLILASYTNPYWLSNFDYCIPLAVIFTIISNRNVQNISYNRNI